MLLFVLNSHKVSAVYIIQMERVFALMQNLLDSLIRKGLFLMRWAFTQHIDIHLQFIRILLNMFLSVLSLALYTKYYALEHNPRGLCVVINNENFSGPILKNRRGTQQDEGM